MQLKLKVFQASTPYKNDNFNKYFYLKNKKYFEIENCTLTYCYTERILLVIFTKFIGNFY